MSDRAGPGGSLLSRFAQGAPRDRRLTLGLVAGSAALVAAVLVAVAMITHDGSAAGPAVTLPPANKRFDYQIGGAYPPAPTVGVVTRDRTQSPVAGKYNICYINAFQTQPGETAFWTGSHSDLLLKKNGRYVIDPDWPDEYALDTSTDAKRAAIAAIVDSWIDGCAAKGFAAVEPDNLDSYTRFAGLTQAGALALAGRLSSHAHAKGLAFAQKNTSELGRAGKIKGGFDFAVAEECQVYSECGAYTEVYGRNVIEIEYTDNPRKAYTQACAAQGRTISVILRDRDVVPAGKAAYRYENC